MIPQLGSFRGYLPKGEHPATWNELVERFGTTSRRKELLEGLLLGARAIRDAGGKELLIDGSFVTKKPRPSDYDCCYDNTQIDYDLLDPVLDDFKDERANQKKKYLGEYFVASDIAQLYPLEPYRTFFQHDKDGRPKGVIILDLTTLP